MTKRELRKKMIAKRKRFIGKKTASREIANILCGLPLWKKANVVCIYLSLPNEVDTSVLLYEDKTIVFPEEAEQKEVELYVVPGVAFDKKGNRLGRGGGFYDRLLQRVKVPKIGLAFDFQVIAQVPITSYDVPMDMIVTEKGVYETKTS